MRFDKKFEVKVWVPYSDKMIFRQRCFEYHLSMMFMGEQYLLKTLDTLQDDQLSKIIENNMIKIKTVSNKDYDIIGIRLTNKYWQKLAFFALNYHSSIAKIASCLFNNALTADETGLLFEQLGLTFVEKPKRRKRKGTDRFEFNERVSDY